MQQCRDWLQQHCAFDGCCMAAGCGVPWLSMVHAESILRLSEVQHVPSMSLHKTSCAGCSWHDAAAVASEVDTAEQPQAGQKHASGRALRAAAAVCGEDLTFQMCLLLFCSRWCGDTRTCDAAAFLHQQPLLSTAYLPAGDRMRRVQGVPNCKVMQVKVQRSCRNILGR